ncbi:hypothetical protein HYU12_01970 [Candidatus Woesearchaeota archaeon]|nr:hypothetical protein [Candidatus Woesearchaeota archaeon]
MDRRIKPELIKDLENQQQAVFLNSLLKTPENSANDVTDIFKKQGTKES